LRLLAKKSPNFFTYGNNPIAKLPDYLESILKKMYPELVAAQAARVKIEATSPGASTNGSKTAKDSGANELCTKEQLEKLASNLGENWPKLLPKLGMDKSEEEKLTSEGKTHAECAMAMLTKWQEMEGEGATKEEITYVVERLKLNHVLDSVFS